MLNQKIMQAQTFFVKKESADDGNIIQLIFGLVTYTFALVSKDLREASKEVLGSNITIFEKHVQNDTLL